MLEALYFISGICVGGLCFALGWLIRDLQFYQRKIDLKVREAKMTLDEENIQTMLAQARELANERLMDMDAPLAS